jgi:hypothetical protein
MNLDRQRGDGLQCCAAEFNVSPAARQVDSVGQQLRRLARRKNPTWESSSFGGQQPGGLPASGAHLPIRLTCNLET